MPHRLKPTLSEFIHALVRPTTFNITANPYILLGLLLGLPIPILMMWLDFYFTGSGSITLMAVAEMYALRPFHYLFLIVPFVAGIVLGAFGTISRENHRRILDLIGQLETLSNTDPLTGMFNRRYLDAELEKEFQRASRSAAAFAVVVVDMDNLKELNDTDGHAAGSRALQAVGRVIIKNCRLYDVPARYGGDEFVVLLPGTDKEQAHAFAVRLRDQVAANEFGGGFVSGSVPVTVSVGVAAYPDDGADPHHVFECADMAMYSAKAGGRNRIVVYG